MHGPGKSIFERPPQHSRALDGAVRPRRPTLPGAHRLHHRVRLSPAAPPGETRTARRDRLSDRKRKHRPHSSSASAPRSGLLQNHEIALAFPDPRPPNILEARRSRLFRSRCALFQLRCAFEGLGKPTGEALRRLTGQDRAPAETSHRSRRRGRPRDRGAARPRRTCGTHLKSVRPDSKLSGIDSTLTRLHWPETPGPPRAHGPGPHRHRHAPAQPEVRPPAASPARTCTV